MSVTILFLADGFSYKYLSSSQTPFLSSLTSNAIYGPVSPSGFFTPHSLYTGIYPDRHHNLFMYGYDPGNSPFKRIPECAKTIDKHLPPLLKDIFRLYLSTYLARRDRLPPTRLGYIPLSLAPYFRKFRPWEICPFPLIFDILKDNRIQTVWDTRDYAFEKKKYLGNILYTKLYSSHFINWLKDNIKNAKNSFIFIQFPTDLDKLGHIFGPESKEVKNEIKKTDANLYSIFNFIKNCHKDFFFGITSDHGMTSVYKPWDILTNLKRIDLKCPKDFIYFLDASCARFWFHNSEIKDHIIQFLNQFSDLGKVLSSEELCQARLPQDHIWGEILFAVRPGILILPNFLQGKRSYQGMHGYFETTLPELNCIFLLYNKSLPSKSISMKLPDVSATILKTFGINPPQFYEGISRL